ncbi:MAG: hypothetical protein WC989_02730 [Micavibrio sp.]
MLTHSAEANVAIRIHTAIQALSVEPEMGTDSMKSMMLYAGMLVECAFLFDNCEEALEGAFARLADLLDCEPYAGPLGERALPPSAIIDFDAEQGRSMTREFFEDWDECAYEFQNMVLVLIQQSFARWEMFGQPRGESFRLIVEATYKAMAFELAAQELCDAVIEQRIGTSKWKLSESVAALAGASGYKLAQSHEGRNQCCWFRGPDLPDLLDQTAYVMTQEAVRHGLCATTDWRFGLPANDTPANPPLTLIRDIEPICGGFFKAIEMHDLDDQAVACAKAAGRMLAIAAGGKKPELEPAIAKPLAMSAITESYKSVCVEYAFMA